ncbi:MAG: spore maturation protein [Clostridia bacterium]|nr:spore maturation protein [Clostridia bacterium]
MLGIIWVFIILLSCLYAFLTGNINQVSEGFFAGASGCVEFVLKVGAFMVLWQGILLVAQKSGLSQKLSKLLGPLISFLFKDVKKESTEANLIANNISANMLGLSNAATPSGIEAMKELSKKSKNGIATDDMCLFAVINTASMQLVPSTLIAMRVSHGSQNAGEILIPVWIVSFLTLVFAICVCKLFSKRGEKKWHK